MHYSLIRPFSIENGPGVRVSLFVSGCRNHCPGCFQKETWNFNFGNEYIHETEDAIVKMVSHERVDGITFLGGEPTEPENQPELLKLAKRLKQEFPKKTIWMYTGCILERDLISGGKNHVEGITDKLLSEIDVLVDGPFIEAEKDLSLVYRGSRNQRIIDMHKYKKTGTISQLYSVNSMPS